MCRLRNVQNGLFTIIENDRHKDGYGKKVLNMHGAGIYSGFPYLFPKAQSKHVQKE